MGLIQLCLILIVIGVLLYLFNIYVTAIDARIKTIINWVVIFCVIVWILQLFGVFNALHGGPNVPHISN